MKDARILLPDLDPESCLGMILGGILESSPKLSIHLRHELLGVFEPSSSGANLSNIISRVTPDVIFLIVSPSHLERIVHLFRSMGRELSELPAIVVTGKCQPDKMFELLKLGVADFITPPLKARDRISCLWAANDFDLLEFQISNR
jgi:DNA-binding NtrC family response regulator